MSMLLRLLLAQAIMWLNIEAEVLQPSSEISTPKTFFAREIHRLQHNRMGTVGANDQDNVLTFKATNTQAFHPSGRKLTDRTNKLTFQTQRFRKNRHAENGHSNRNLPTLIPLISKGHVQGNQIGNCETSVQEIRNSKNIENGYNQSAAEKPEDTNPFIHSSLKVSNEIQQVKTVPLNTNGYPLMPCTCKLSKCDCSGLLIKLVPQDLPSTITELLLNDNEIDHLVIHAFARYIYLDILVLAHNMMYIIEEGAFSGLSRLEYLDLSGNDLLRRESHIAVKIFQPLKSLKILRMDTNIERSINVALDSVLSYLENVEELYIDNYIDTEKGEFFGPGFKNMTSLRNLTITCRVSIIGCLLNSTFLYVNNITSLDIKNCGIDGPCIEAGAFSHFRQLETLDISDNTAIGMKYLPLITCALNSSNFKTLSMNYIANDHLNIVINTSVTECMPKTLITLSARGNHINYIDREAVLRLPTSLRTIDIRDNSINTNPEEIPLEHFVQLETLLISSNREECVTSDDNINLKTTFRKSRFQKSKKCARTNKTQKSKEERKLNSILPSTLTRVKIAVHNINECYLNHIDERNNLQEIDLSCSYLTTLSLISFHQLPHLRSVIAIRSSMYELIPSIIDNIESIETLILEGNYLNAFLESFSWPFYYLVNLLHLDLSLNQLKNLNRDVFHGLAKLEYLHLNNNSFSAFEADISNMTQLKLLDLSNTELSQLPGDVRAHIDKLCKVNAGQVKVDMSGCPIQCDCFNLDFLKWMVNSPAFDKNFTGYKCKYQDTSFKDIKDGYQETIHVLDRECAKNYPMFLIILAATTILMSTVVGAIVYRFRWKIRYLYYAAYLKIMDKHKNDNQQEFVYDVFISYDYEDHTFVTRHMAPELENRGLKLLIHGRDFVAGTYIASNIVMAVSESRKTLVVLTRNLLESTWCNYELQMATMEAVHTGRQVLVFLLKENIPNNELDLDLLRHIRSNTYIPYPGPEEERDADVMKKLYDKLAHDLRL